MYTSSTENTKINSDTLMDTLLLTKYFFAGKEWQLISSYGSKW